MIKSDVIVDIDLVYDKDKLVKEMEQVNFLPYNDLGPKQKGTSNIPEGSWFKNPDTWLLGHVTKELPEVSKVVKQLEKLFGSKDIRPRFYKQEANTFVPLHTDTGTLSAVNIILSEDYAPVKFEGLGFINYKCALIDTQKRHGVPEHPTERLLLKFSMFDVSFEECKLKLRESL